MNTPKVERKQASFWTDENKAICKRMYIDEDLSSSIVGAFLGVTRNSVIGIINRMGLKKDAPTRTPKPPGERKPYRRARTAADKVERRSEPPMPALISGEDIPPLLASLHDITHWVCSYPYGTPATQFCGRPKTRGAFCSAHARLCYQEPRTLFTS